MYCIYIYIYSIYTVYIYILSIFKIGIDISLLCSKNRVQKWKVTRVCWIGKALRLVETAWDKRQPDTSLYGESLGPRSVQDVFA